MDLGMSELPKGWVISPLEELVFFKKGTKPKILIEQKKDGFVPYIDIRAFEKNEIRQFADVASSKIATENDVLVVWDGARCGLAGIGKNGAIGSTIMCLTPIIFSPKYLFHYLRTEYDNVNSDHKGTGIPHVKPELFWNLKVPLAPLNEQKRIVEKLDKLLLRVEEAKARLEKIHVIIKRFRQSVLNAAVTGELTKDWREKNDTDEELNEKSLRELCIKFTYGSSKKSEIKGRVPVLRMGNIQDGKIIWNDLKYTSDHDEIKKYSLEIGDVLFNRTNSPELVGKTAIYRGEQPAIYAGYLIKVKTGEKLNPEYLNLCLNSVQAKEWCLQVKTDGVSQSNINAQKLADFKVLTPQIEEQKEIVKRVEALFKKADEIEERFKKAKAFVDKLTQSMLAKAFRGELVPQDPNDEPASELLEKIKQEKEKLNANRKKRSPKRTTEPAQKLVEKVKKGKPRQLSKKVKSYRKRIKKK